MRSAALWLLLAACFSKPARPGDPAAACGDGTLDDGEVCDDGNADDGDGCTASCTFEPWFECPAPGELCHPVLQLRWVGIGSLLPVLGSPGGGTAFEEECGTLPGVDGPNTVVVGLDVTSDPDQIARIRALCADITLRDDGRIGWSGEVATQTHGNDAGMNPQTALCADDEVVVGFDGNASANFASGISVICQKLTHANGVLESGTPRKLAVVGPDNQINQPTAQCTDAGVARALDGRSGAIIDQMTLRCVPTSEVICGDGHTDDPETCDDGNANPGDGCNATCSGE